MPTHEIFWPATRNDIHWGIWVGTALIALITLGRAASGALTAGIAPGWVMFVVVVGICCNLLTWWWSLPAADSDSARAQIARGTVAVSPSLIVGVLLAGASTAALLGVLALVACGLTTVIVIAQQRATTAGVANSATPVAPTIELAASTTTSPTAATPAEAFDDPMVHQQIIRRRTVSGADSLEALLRVEFAADQREASIHLPIQPALEGFPHVECEPLDDADVEFKVAATHPYGVRIDARRTGRLQDSATISVGILVHSASEAEAAA